MSARIPSKPGRLALGALAFALLSRSTAPAQAEIVAIGGVDGLERGIEIGSVSVAVLEDGGFAISGTQASAEGIRFIVQRFGPDGRTTGPTLSLVHGAVPIGGVGSLGDRYIVTWSRPDGQPARAAVLEESAEKPARARPWLPSDVFEYAAYYRYGASPSWSLLPVSFSKIGKTAVGGDVFEPVLQVFTPQLRSSGGVIVAGPPTRHVELLDAAINGKGRVAVLSSQCPASFAGTRPCQRGLQLFDRGGGPRSSFATGGLTQDHENVGAFRIALSETSRTLVLWSSTVGEENLLLAQVLDLTGAAVGAPTTLERRGKPFAVAQGARWLDPSKAAAFWIVENFDDLTASIVAAELVGGSPRLAESRELTHGYVYAGTLRFGMNGSGMAVVYWSTLDDDQEFSGHAMLVRFR